MPNGHDHLDYQELIRRVKAERDQARALLRDCEGPLRVALSEFEEDDRMAPKLEALLARIEEALA